MLVINFVSRVSLQHDIGKMKIRAVSGEGEGGHVSTDNEVQSQT